MQREAYMSPRNPSLKAFPRQITGRSPSSEETVNQEEIKTSEDSEMFTSNRQSSSISEDGEHSSETTSSCSSPTHPRLFKVLQELSSPLPFEDGREIK